MRTSDELKEAIKVIEEDALYNPETAEISKECIEKCNKHRWHDLRKNPNDLPSDEFILTIAYKNGFYTIATTHHVRMSNFDAWSYIDPVEE